MVAGLLGGIDLDFLVPAGWIIINFEEVGTLVYGDADAGTVADADKVAVATDCWNGVDPEEGVSKYNLTQ